MKKVSIILLEGIMVSKNVKFVLICLLLTICWIVPVVASEVIIRSAYYGSIASVQGADQIPRSYAAQLGLTTQDTTLSSPEQRVLTAISNNRYPVTPGDTISLVYTDGKTTVSLTLQVNGEYRIVVPALGSVEGKGKTFSEFASEIERLVLTYIPFSLPRVSLIGTGSFSVTVKGEVASTKEVTVWGLSRLSSVLSNATSLASTRKVLITSSTGETREYDIYRALREGDLSQNPLLRSGDIITLLPAERIVILSGEIARAGAYQPLAQETLSTVIAQYGRGILPSGDSQGVLVRRYSAEGTIDVIRVDASQAATFALQHLDTVFVNPLVPRSRAVTLEGAVNQQTTQTQTSLLGSSHKIYYQFFPGETVLEMMLGVAGRFSAVSDLSSTYLLRDSQLIPIDVQSLLLGKDSPQASLQLKEGDRFVVPFNQLFVTVAGGVFKPGTYPYIPDKDASYYINLAGGVDPAKSRNGDFTLVNKEGSRLSKDAQVTPESIITVKLNTFQATSGLNLTTTVTIVGLIATIVGIVATVSKL